jgi:hypothetical protein
LSPTLLGDAIENPGNVLALRETAALFGWDCAFGSKEVPFDLGPFSPVVALENEDGAASIHGFRVPLERLVLVVGNERRGIGRDVLARADHVVKIPLASRRVNTLNVAAAAAAALASLVRGGGGKLHDRADPARNRPDLLLLGGDDPVELGSAIRSAAAFGWERLLVDDRHGIWFDPDRVTRSEGRGAARRGKNPIRVVRVPAGSRLPYDEACLVSALPGGEPLHRASLARGPRQLVVLADERASPFEAFEGSVAGRVRHVSLDLPGVPRFRLSATIALAEIARQVGQRLRPGGGRAKPAGYALELEELTP